MMNKGKPRRFRYGLRVLAMGLDPETGQGVSKEFVVRDLAGVRSLVEGVTACGYAGLAFRNLGPAPRPAPRQEGRP